MDRILVADDGSAAAFEAGEVLDSIIDEAAAYVGRDVGQSLGPRVLLESKSRNDRAAIREIIDFVREHGVDLIVLGNRAGGMRGLIPGSVSQGVASTAARCHDGALIGANR